MSDFPEFDAQYQTILVKDKTDRFEQLAAEANFNVYHSDIWRGTGRRFAELIVQECCRLIKENEHNLVPGYMQRMTADAEVSLIKKHFDIK